MFGKKRKFPKGNIADSKTDTLKVRSAEEEILQLIVAYPEYKNMIGFSQIPKNAPYF